MDYEILDFETLVIREAESIREQGIKAAKKVHLNIREFNKKIEESREEIISKLNTVLGVKYKDTVFAVLDPTNRFFSIVNIEPLVKDEPFPTTFIVEMKPPFIPHFYLIISYLKIFLNLQPTGIIRTDPVVGLISVLVRGDELVATAAQLAVGISSIKNIIRGDVSIYPLMPELLDLPVEVEDDKLYLTNLGYATRPINTGFVVELDISDIPKLEKEVVSKLSFKSLKSILSEVSKVIRDEYWIK